MATQATLPPADQVPKQECDLVMKGGVTSGVAYPPVVLRLKETYRFRKIGGTSAGAMAAAATAAAEYGRESGGFDKLCNVQKDLEKPKYMRNLFQPSPETQALMNIVDVFFADAKPSQKNKTPNRVQSVLSAILYYLPRWFKIWITHRWPPLSPGAIFGIIAGMILAFFLYVTIFGTLALVLQIRMTFTSPISLAILGICGIADIGLGYQVGAVIDAIWKLSNANNLYGICTGQHKSEAQKHPTFNWLLKKLHLQKQAPPVLTDWMSSMLDTMAGLDSYEMYKAGQIDYQYKPLTFHHLKDKKICQDPNGHYQLCKNGKEGKDVGITLRMITTNLSQGQPLVLPTGLQGFLFREADMDILFPKHIVKYMIKKEGASPLVLHNLLPQGFHFLPNEDDLPVVVAMRLSLSFPILISAVPLYTIKESALTSPAKMLKPDDMQVNWFSDGGICNNFPIEFFDAWMPNHPTFGINLVSLPDTAFDTNNHQVVTVGNEKITTLPLNGDHISALNQKHMQKQSSPPRTDVCLPPPQTLQNPEWHGWSHTWQFLAAVISTGLGYRDMMQANLPSYRERIVQIRLNKKQGGLNLNMPTAIIKQVVDKGKVAGELLEKDFNFQQHQWVRFLVMMKQMEQNLSTMHMAIKPGEPFREFLNNQGKASVASSNLPYPRDPEWCRLANTPLDDLCCLIMCWQETARQWAKTHDQGEEALHDELPTFFQQDAPEPDPVLRVTPEV